MLAFSGCYYGGGDKEKKELGAIRKRWKTLHVRLSCIVCFLNISNLNPCIYKENLKKKNLNMIVKCFGLFSKDCDYVAFQGPQYYINRIKTREKNC